MATSELASYAINIAAQMVGVDQTSADLDKLSASLAGGGKDAEHLERAMIDVEAALKSATASSLAAGDALALGRNRYKDLESAALKSAKAAERAALKNGGVVPDKFLAHLNQARSALEAESGSLKKLEDTASKAAAAQARLGEQSRKLAGLNTHLNKKLGDTNQKVSALQGALGQIGGPLGALGQKVLGPVKAYAELNEKFDATTARRVVMITGAAAVASSMVMMGGAIGVGVVALTGLAIAFASAHRSSMLALEAFEASNEAFAGFGATAKQVTAVTGIATDELMGLGKALKAAKVTADDMPAALMAAATAEKALGKGGSAEFLEALKAGKKSVGELSAEVQGKFGGTVAKQMLGIGEQFATFKRNIAELFSGLNIEPFLVALRDMLGFFDSSTKSGQELKATVTGIFQPLIDFATAAIPVVEALFLGIAIGAVKAYIAIKPAINAIRDMLGLNQPTAAESFAKITKTAEQLTIAVLAIGAAVATVAVGFLAFAVLTSPITGIALAIVGIGAALYGLGMLIAKSITGWILLFDDLGAYFRKFADGFAEVGFNIVRGMADGIDRGAQWIIDAVKNALGGAVKAGKALLGIASPSKVYGEMGEDSAEGYANAVERETPNVRAAVTDMAAPPKMRKAEATAAAGASSGSARAPIDLSGATFNFSGVANAEQATSLFGDMLTRLLEGDVESLGGEPA